MKKNDLNWIQFKNSIDNLISLSDITKSEKDALIEGLDNLSPKQLISLLVITKNNPEIVKVIAKQAYQKKMILDKKDRDAWMKMLEKEEADLGKKFLEIMDDEIKKEDASKLDELRKTM